MSPGLFAAVLVGCVVLALVAVVASQWLGFAAADRRIAAQHGMTRTVWRAYLSAGYAAMVNDRPNLDSPPVRHLDTARHTADPGPASVSVVLPVASRDEREVA